MRRDYQIDSKIADSPTGQGAVYKVTHYRTGTQYCLKTAKDGHHHNLKAETEALRTLKHPHIITMHDTGEYRHQGETWHYIVTELMEQNLRKTIESGIHTEQAEKIAIQILEGLQHAHTQGILHLDLKPENILLTGKTAKICDFSAPTGLENRIRNSLGSGSTPLMTTEKYRAPEVKEGTLSPKADIYSTGVIIYEMLTGKLPGIRYKPASTIAGNSTTIDKLLDKMMEEEPTDRINIQEAITTLQTPETSEKIKKRKQSKKQENKTGWLKNIPLKAKIAACAAPIIIAATTYLTTQTNLPEDPLFYWKSTEENGKCYIQFPYKRDLSAGAPRNYPIEEKAIPRFRLLLRTMNAIDVMHNQLDDRRAIYDVEEVRKIIKKLSEDGKITKHECETLLVKIEGKNKALSLVTE